MKYNEVKVGLKVMIGSGPNKAVIVSPKIINDCVSVGGDNLPCLSDGRWGVVKEWWGKNFIRYDLRELTALQDQKSCIYCNKSRTRFTIDKERALDGKCWSCFNV